MCWVALMLVSGIAAAGWFYFRSQNSQIAVHSIAVLPFINVSKDSEMEYLSDGISESLINSLSQLRGIKVIARNSAFKYKGADVDLKEVAKALGVDAIPTGRLIQRGENLAISVELVNASDKTQIWSQLRARLCGNWPMPIAFLVTMAPWIHKRPYIEQRMHV